MQDLETLKKKRKSVAIICLGLVAMVYITFAVIAWLVFRAKPYPNSYREFFFAVLVLGLYFYIFELKRIFTTWLVIIALLGIGIILLCFYDLSRIYFSSF